MHANAQDASLETIASHLLGDKVLRVDAAAGGGNSRIYKVTASNHHYALKRYPTIAEDSRDRLGTEREALRFFARHHVVNVPRWINGDAPYALMQWIDGASPVEVTGSDLNACLKFLGSVLELSTHIDAMEFKPASEACLNGAEVERQVEARLQKLLEKAAAEKPLVEFLHDVFAPKQREVFAATRAAYASAGLDFNQDIPSASRSLIPADFGLHNALKQADGSLVFIDFEYFGWDDPVKLTADFMLHPAMEMAIDQQQYFAAGMIQIRRGDAHFGTRLRALLPCFGLRWTLILLNEFLPERLAARAYARSQTDLDAMKDKQLAKARQMLDTSLMLAPQLILERHASPDL